MTIRNLPDEAVKQVFTDNWPIRRRWLRITVLWLGLNSQWVIVWGLIKDSSIAIQALMILLGALMSLLVAYIFGAVWDDHNKRRAIPYWEHGDRGDDCDNESDEKNDDFFLPSSGTKKDTE